jgi:two-component system cell cycle sensor histidine kinase/response regulator CckA
MYNPELAGLLRILHIEDNANDAELIAHRLAADGLNCEFRVVTCEREIRQAVESTCFDLILSDFALPDFDGLSALEFAKTVCPDVPFIFVSGTIGEERAINSLHAGATDYVLKERLERLATAVCRSVLEARQAAERTKAVIALQESEERFRQVTENIEEVFWLADLAPRRIVYVSPAYARVWGRQREQLCKEPSSWLNSVHPADRQRVEAAIARQGLEPYETEYRIVRPDGAVRWVNDRAFPITDEAGKVYRLAGVAQDITARRNLEQEIGQANKMEALGQFAGGIAHDFNNVLAVIQMQATLLLAEPELRDKLRSGVENMMAAATRAANLTRQLLTFSRREAQQARDIDMLDLVTGTAKLLRRIVNENITFETRFEPALPAVHADPSMIEQVLMNLVVNARDAMPDGGQLIVAMEVTDVGPDLASAHLGVRPGRFIRLSVADTGCGIPAENLAHIFEPFFTTKEPGCGTGLGLATVMRIVTQHHGWIDVQSESGSGTVFQVYLPALDHPPLKTKLHLPPLSHGNGERILLLEDDEAVRAMARLVLEQFGYCVVEAATAPAAMERWEKYNGNFELLVTDLILPGGMSGANVAQRLRSAHPKLKIIYTSGYTSDVVARHLSIGNRDVILQKPFSADALVLAVRNSLDGADSTQT